MTLKLTYEQKLYSRLATIRRKSGPMQALATEECDVLRKIVAVLQFKLNNAQELANTSMRNVRKQEKLIKLYRSVSNEYAVTLKDLRTEVQALKTPQKPLPSNLPAPDL